METGCPGQDREAAHSDTRNSIHVTRYMGILGIVALVVVGVLLWLAGAYNSLGGAYRTASRRRSARSTSSSSGATI